MRFFHCQISFLAHLTFRPQKLCKQVAIGGHWFLWELYAQLYSKNAFHQNCSEQTILRTVFGLKSLTPKSTPPSAPHYPHLPPLTTLPLFTLLHVSIWTHLSCSLPNISLHCLSPLTLAPHLLHHTNKRTHLSPLMLASLSSSSLLAKQTARGSFESNSSDASQICLFNSRRHLHFRGVSFKLVSFV